MSNRPRFGGGDPRSLRRVVGLATAFQNLVDQAPGFGIFGGHEIVTLQRCLNRGVVVAGVLDVDLVQAALQLFGLARVDHDVGGLTLIAARGWWTMTREFGSEKRMPFSPAVSSRLHIEAAWPMTKVETLGRMYCIVS